MSRHHVNEQPGVHPLRQACAGDNHEPRHTVTPPFRSANRSYHLFLNRVKMDFMVAVVTIEGSNRSHSASVVTVLTRDHFENDAGPIGKRALRVAASRVLNPVDFRRWEEGKFGPGGTRRRYRVFTY
ncbi:hypothetical protein [Paraburkholderia sp. J10-1]|uniref:hypothetical protein n=1 Tax=Paraburkholderia sp. J10-1 TaxID=2805430 RepID=UPI002AB66E9A|nr:hypothetical protein [Paraburkholderia sp. J10-1]